VEAPNGRQDRTARAHEKRAPIHSRNISREGSQGWRPCEPCEPCELAGRMPPYGNQPSWIHGHRVGRCRRRRPDTPRRPA
jgi:hypothetical protein